MAASHATVLYCTLCPAKPRYEEGFILSSTSILHKASNRVKGTSLPATYIQSMILCSRVSREQYYAQRAKTYMFGRTFLASACISPRIRIVPR
jgi:hypothetical protein